MSDDEDEKDFLEDDIIDKEDKDDDESQPEFDIKKTSRFKAKENAQKLTLLLDSFNEKQAVRYEAFRCSAFKKKTVKKTLLEIASSVSNETVIVVAGIAKIYCGEIIETARVVQKEWQKKGPLRPEHIREAILRLKNIGRTTIAGSHSKKYPFGI